MLFYFEQHCELCFYTVQRTCYNQKGTSPPEIKLLWGPHRKTVPVSPLLGVPPLLSLPARMLKASLPSPRIVPLLSLRRAASLSALLLYQCKKPLEGVQTRTLQKYLLVTACDHRPVTQDPRPSLLLPKLHTGLSCQTRKRVHMTCNLSFLAAPNL